MASDPGLNHFDIARLITSKDEQIVKENELFKQVRYARVVWRDLEKCEYCVVFVDVHLANFRAAIRGRYATTKKGAFEIRVSELDFRLFCLITPYLDRKVIESIPEYLWAHLVRCVFQRFIQLPLPEQSLLDDRSLFFRLPQLQKEFKAEWQAEQEKIKNGSWREQQIVRLEAGAQIRLEAARNAITMIETELAQAIASLKVATVPSVEESAACVQPSGS